MCWHASGEERAVGGVVKDDVDAHQEPPCGHRQRQGKQVGDVERQVHEGRQAQIGRYRGGNVHQATAQARLRIWSERLFPRGALHQRPFDCRRHSGKCSGALCGRCVDGKAAGPRIGRAGSLVHIQPFRLSLGDLNTLAGRRTGWCTLRTPGFANEGRCRRRRSLRPGRGASARAPARRHGVRGRLTTRAATPTPSASTPRTRRTRRHRVHRLQRPQLPELRAPARATGVAEQRVDDELRRQRRDGRLRVQQRIANGLFAKRAHLVTPWFHRMVADLVRFNRAARELLAIRR